LLALWHIHESLFGELVLLDVSLLKLNAALKHWNEFFWRILFVIPKNIVRDHGTLLDNFTSFDLSEVQNVELALSNHLVGDLNE
jgi:hypothetical protein